MKYHTLTASQTFPHPAHGAAACTITWPRASPQDTLGFRECYDSRFKHGKPPIKERRYMITNLRQITNSEKEEKAVNNKRGFVINEPKIFKAVECSKDAGGWDFFSINENLPFLKEVVFSHVSHRLLSKYGYWNEKGEIRLTYFVDLLTQSRLVVLDSQKYPGYPPSIFTGLIVLPNEQRDEIVIAPNDCGKLTIKLRMDA